MELDQFIKNFASQFEELDVANIDKDVEFKQLETWDSLTAFSVQMMIEDEYGVKISPDEFKSVTSVTDLFNLVVLRRQ